MNFTFGIITDESNPTRLKAIVDSIARECSLDYRDNEIIICGPCSNNYNRTLICDLGAPLDGPYAAEFGEYPITHIDFDNQPKGWITKMKNLIVQAATKENVVLLHDYVSLAEGWYKGFQEFGNDWDVCMTRIENLDGTRFRDWITCDDPQYCHPWNWDAKIVPYEYNKTQWMYVSGAYIIGKRDFLRQHPLNENLFWGQGEDVEWSKRIRHKWNYKMNQNSKAKLLKQQEIALQTVESL